MQQKNNYRSFNVLSKMLWIMSIFSTLFLLVGELGANNLQINNTVLTGQNTADDFYLIQFDLSWENSWREIAPAFNRDAAWVFVKYRVNKGIWQHATLNYVDGSSTNDGHFAPLGSSIDTPSDGKGVFIYRDVQGFGINNWTGIRLRWNYGIDGVGDFDEVQVCVIGIEMVYVKEGAFAVGSGGTEVFHFLEGGGGNNPYQITSDGAIPVADSMGSLWYYEFFMGDDQDGPVPAIFPNGYSAFYCMKYEISQEQYKNFLNLLSYNEQTTRTSTLPNSTAGTLALASSENMYCNGISIKWPGVDSTKPAMYACNFNDDGNFDQPDDGQNIACNCLNWEDGTAYMDWSGLRPMTELEYEKACRGTITPNENEYAWGTTNIHNAPYTLVNSGFPNENINAALGVGNAGYNATILFNGIVNRPLRCGIFASSIATPSREESGSSYWGIMELSGNLCERVVTIGNPVGRSFNGTHGDGFLTIEGKANTVSWPVMDSVGSGFRGGSWFSFVSILQVSNRLFASLPITSRNIDHGWRGVRSYP